MAERVDRQWRANRIAFVSLWNRVNWDLKSGQYKHEEINMLTDFKAPNEAGRFLQQHEKVSFEHSQLSACFCSCIWTDMQGITYSASLRISWLWFTVWRYTCDVRRYCIWSLMAPSRYSGTERMLCWWSIKNDTSLVANSSSKSHSSALPRTQPENVWTIWNPRQTSRYTSE